MHSNAAGRHWPTFWIILGCGAALAAIAYLLSQMPEPYQRIGYSPLIGAMLGYGLTFMMPAFGSRWLPPSIFATLGSAFAAVTANLALGWIVFGLLGTSTLVLFALEMSRSADR